MTNLKLILLMLIFATSCKKVKPKIGEYEAIFAGTYVKSGETLEHNRYRRFRIIDFSKNTISIAIYSNNEISSTLNYNDNEISGVFYTPDPGGTGGPSFAADSIHITGISYKKKGKFYISGQHNYTYTDVDVLNQEINHYTVTGTFEVKPI